ncbi:MAG: hypothetical protein IT439_03630 [Phycisphaerales bacterium]|nr:hypothetical protein [Phycisphaerales bacterium]
MAKEPVCLVCKVVMEPGFLTERGDAQLAHLPHWCRGEPKPGYVGGDAQSARHAEGYPVVAYRCPTCEALRLYAPTRLS